MAKRNILGGFEQLRKNFDSQYDFYKHLTTISSGAIVIIVAFVKQRLQTGQKIAIVTAIIAFLLSVVSALLVMLNVGIQSQNIGNLAIRLGLGDSEQDTEIHRNHIERRWDTIDLFQKFVTGFFALGMLAAIAFFLVSVF